MSLSSCQPVVLKSHIISASVPSPHLLITGGIQKIRDEGHDAVLGNAVRKGVQRAAGVESAEALIVAIPDPLNAGAIIDTAKALNPNILVLARGLRDSDVEYLTEHGANRVILGVHEVADIMIDAVTPGGESITQG